MGKNEASGATTTVAAGVSEVANGSNGKSKKKQQQPPPPLPEPSSSLTISRNKHWRFISAFHGPWLQLPHEILETLAQSNYLSPPPRQAHAGVLFDLLKVRKLVDEAADLAVRAQNGTAASALASDNGLPGAALGINTRAGANARLSPERKHRMRELATQKLSQAYRLDEIAASVATMQSASALESVASLVLQRAPNNHDAQYVHFFHEKIPSRMLAEYTSLRPLDDIVTYEHGHAAPLRTRALTRIFKEDYHGAIQDLTEALNLCKLEQARQARGKTQLVSAQQAREEADKRRQGSRDWAQDIRISDEDQPRSMEMQLLFQRGSQYLTLACQNIKISLESFHKIQNHGYGGMSNQAIFLNPSEALTVMTSTEQELFRRGLEAREMLRKYAKRALRDHTAFLAQLDYALATLKLGPSEDIDPGQIRKLLLENDGHSDSHREPTSSHTLARHTDPSQGSNRSWKEHTSPKFDVYALTDLLSDSPPVGLPALTGNGMAAMSKAPQSDARVAHHEMITYHPLMLECLHTVLLAHSLLQSPPTSINRIAINVARVARLADGYPFFLGARSPARADWSEVLRKTQDWVKLPDAWDTLCRVPDGAGRSTTGARANGAANGRPSGPNDGSVVGIPKDHKDEGSTKDNDYHRAAFDTLSDGAREERALHDTTPQSPDRGRFTPPLSEPLTPSSEVATPTSTDNGEEEWSLIKHLAHSRENGEPFGRGMPANKGTVAKDEEYMIGIERAEAIAQWVLEAPAVVGNIDGSRPKRKKKSARKPQDPSNLENSVESLHVTDPD